MDTIPVLYYNDISPPVRFVLMTIKALNINIKLHEIDFLSDEQKGPEFTKINPLKKLPTLKFGDLIINDSHAICSYLVDKYAPDNPLYPKNLEERAKINSILFFNNGILFPREAAILTSAFKISQDMPFEKLVETFQESLSYLEAFSGKNKWLLGDHMTLADLCCISTYSTAKLMVEIKKGTYPNIDSWEAVWISDPVVLHGNLPGLENLKVVLRKHGNLDHVNEKFKPFILKNIA